MKSELINLSTVYQRTEDWNFGQTVFTIDSLRVLAGINGSNSLSEIKSDLTMAEERFLSAVNYLEELGLIEMVEVSFRPVDSVITEEVNNLHSVKASQIVAGS